MDNRLQFAQLRERIALRALVASKTAYQWARRRSPAQVVFVAGMQRSGTNMLMDRFERSYVTDVYHERDRRAFDNYRMRELGVIRRLVAQSRAHTVVIKALCELDRLRELMAEFAPAKTVWVVRDYRDAVRSALNSFNNFTKQVSRIVEDRYVDDWRAGGMSETTHAILRRLWHADMNDVSAAALIWYFRNVLYFEQGLDRDPRVYLVVYEELVQDPQRECSAVFEFLDVPYSHAITRGVFATSIRHAPLVGIEPAIAELCESLAERFAQVLSRSSNQGLKR